MWFRNRLVNPVVRLLLRSPLHPVLSRSLVILSYQGRRTGRWRSLPCMYARDGQDLYVVPGQPDRKVWWRTCANPPRSGCACRVATRVGTAAASSDPETVAAGLRRYLARYPKTAKPLRVRLDPDGTVTVRRPLVVVSVHLVDPTGSTDGGPAFA